MTETVTAKASATAPKNGSRKRVMYFDLLSIIACFGVVALHCNGGAHAWQPTPVWAQELAVEVLFFWAVPVFFMLSGAKTMEYRARRTTREFLVHRMTRLFVPFIAWSAIIFFLRNRTLDVPLFLVQLKDGSIETVYWFFYTMFGVTLSMPVLSALAEHKRVMWYLVGVVIVLQTICAPLCVLLDIRWNTSFSLPVASGYVMYVVLGYLLATDEERFITPRRRRVLYALGVAALLFRYVYTYLSSNALGEVDRATFDYIGFCGFFPAVALFLLFKHIEWEKRTPWLQRHSKAVVTVAGATFGIYLTHILWIRDILPPMGMPMDSAFARLACPFLIFVACMVIVLILKRIPVLRRLVP